MEAESCLYVVVSTSVTTTSAVGMLNAAFLMLSGNFHRKRRLVEESSAIKVSRISHMISKRKSSKVLGKTWKKQYLVGQYSQWLCCPRGMERKYQNVNKSAS